MVHPLCIHHSICIPLQTKTHSQPFRWFSYVSEPSRDINKRYMVKILYSLCSLYINLPHDYWLTTGMKSYLRVCFAIKITVGCINMDSYKQPIVGDIKMQCDGLTVSTQARVMRTTSLNHLYSGGTILGVLLGEKWMVIINILPSASFPLNLRLWKLKIKIWNILSPSFSFPEWSYSKTTISNYSLCLKHNILSCVILKMFWISWIAVLVFGNDFESDCVQ